MAPRGQDRDELGRFVAGMGEASDKLKSFTRDVEDSAQASAENTRAKKEEAETAKSHSAFVSGLASAGVGALSRAASAEDLDAGLSGLAQAGIKGLRSLPGGDLMAEAAGLGRAERVLGTAGERALDVTGDLRRYGIEVSDEMRKGLLDTFVEQEERVEKERAKVSGEAFSLERVGGELLQRLQEYGELMKQIHEAIRAFGGGGN